MNDLEAWLDEMVDAPLPGGLAAAAVAAALGAALVAKVGRIVLARPGLPAGARAAIEPLAALAQAERRGLVALAAADVEAYRAVLSDRANGLGDAQALPSHSLAPRDVRQGAVEVPVRLAERCLALRLRLPALLEHAGPAIAVDLHIGAGLLEAGQRAGVLCAAANLRAWGQEIEPQELWARLETLRENA